MTLSFRHFLLTVTTFLCFVTVLELAPTKPREPGPCVGMDCLHGVLMHGDDKVGVEHEHESEKVNTGVAGVKTIDEEMHGVLMHGDDKVGVEHEHTEEETDKGVAGVKTIDEMMHGVMMHGDEAPGIDHTEDHDFEKKIDDTVIKYERLTQKDTVEEPEKLIHDPVESLSESSSNIGNDGIRNRLYNWITSAWNGLFGSSQTDNGPKAHDMLDDLELVGNSGPEKHSHDHPEKHPRMEKEKHARKAHTEN